MLSLNRREADRSAKWTINEDNDLRPENCQARLSASRVASAHIKGFKLRFIAGLKEAKVAFRGGRVKARDSFIGREYIIDVDHYFPSIVHCAVCFLRFERMSRFRLSVLFYHYCTTLYRLLWMRLSCLLHVLPIDLQIQEMQNA
jgi:hypothetical protein